MPETQNDPRANIIKGLREFADFLENNPDVPHPSPHLYFNAPVRSRARIIDIARLTSWTKEYFGDWFALRRVFGGTIKFDIVITRESVCRKVTKGTKEIPAQPARTEELFDWVCDEPLLAASVE